MCGSTSTNARWIVTFGVIQILFLTIANNKESLFGCFYFFSPGYITLTVQTLVVFLLLLFDVFS
jgi:hypothetical protein